MLIVMISSRGELRHHTSCEIDCEEVIAAVGIVRPGEIGLEHEGARKPLGEWCRELWGRRRLGFGAAHGQ